MYKYEVVCNNCDFKGYEEDLIEIIEFKENENSELKFLPLKEYNFRNKNLFVSPFEHKVFCGCPKCFADSYTMEVEYKEED